MTDTGLIKHFTDLSSLFTDVARARRARDRLDGEQLPAARLPHQLPDGDDHVRLDGPRPPGEDDTGEHGAQGGDAGGGTRADVQGQHAAGENEFFFHLNSFDEFFSTNDKQQMVLFLTIVS